MSIFQLQVIQSSVKGCYSSVHLGSVGYSTPSWHALTLSVQPLYTFLRITFFCFYIHTTEQHAVPYDMSSLTIVILQIFLHPSVCHFRPSLPIKCENSCAPPGICSYFVFMYMSFHYPTNIWVLLNKCWDTHCFFLFRMFRSHISLATFLSYCLRIITLRFSIFCLPSGLVADALTYSSGLSLSESVVTNLIVNIMIQIQNYMCHFPRHFQIRQQVIQTDRFQFH